MFISACLLTGGWKFDPHSATHLAEWEHLSSDQLPRSLSSPPFSSFCLTNFRLMCSDETRALLCSYLVQGKWINLVILNACVHAYVPCICMIWPVMMSLLPRFLRWSVRQWYIDNILRPKNKLLCTLWVCLNPPITAFCSNSIFIGEFGDYDPSDHPPGYLDDFPLLDDEVLTTSNA